MGNYILPYALKKIQNEYYFDVISVTSSIFMPDKYPIQIIE